MLQSMYMYIHYTGLLFIGTLYVVTVDILQYIFLIFTVV